MTTLAEYFEREARAYVGDLRTLAGRAVPDADAVLRAARLLRGTAQMAREERVYRAAMALETAVRGVATGGAGAWTEGMVGHVRAAVDDLAVLVDGNEPSPELDGRLRAALERWRAAGVELPEAVLGRPPARDGAGNTREFRQYAAREVTGIVDALDGAGRALRVNPMDREALRAILRRQRALRGAARLEEIPVVAEILRAVEDLTRLVARLDVAVRDEWYDVYRVAREGLAAAVPALAEDRDPPPSPALARLRHVRSELIQRYAASEPPPAGAGVARPAPAASAGGLSAPTGELPAVPTSALEYRGEAALRRALELRPGLEAAIGNDVERREQLDELFDLIRLALG